MASHGSPHRRYLGGLLTLSSLLIPAVAHADVIISEYVEGGGNNKAIELLNTGSSSVDLQNCEVLLYSNGAATPSASAPVAESSSLLAPGAVTVLVTSNPNASAPLKSLADFTNSAVNFNGDDAVEIRCDGLTQDILGQIGVQQEWGSGDTSTKDNTIRRNISVTSGDKNGNDTFTLNQWQGYEKDTIDGLGLPGQAATDPTGFSCSDSTQSIGSVQGSGDTAPLDGSATQVVVKGVVTRDYESDAQGFFIQDSGDGNSATSDAIWVFNAGRDEVSVGQEVIVKGTVKEYSRSGDEASITEIEALAVSVCGSGVQPAPVSIDPSDVSAWERYEGMLVTLDRSVTVTENRELERYGQFGVAYDGRGPGGLLAQPTALAAPGSTLYDTILAENKRRFFYIDDNVNEQNLYPTSLPQNGLLAGDSNARTLRAGTRLSAVSGVLDYRFNDWRIRVNSMPTVTQADARPQTPPSVGGRLKVADFNVLNYFTTLDNGTRSCNGQFCRGADSPEELERQRNKLLPALDRLDADVIALHELENNYANFASSAARDLATRLNNFPGRSSCSGGSWVAVNPGRNLGTDAIANGLMYCNATVTLTGRVGVLDDAMTAQIGADVEFPVFDGVNTNRMPIAATFKEKASDISFTVVATHQKSKGGSPDDCSDPSADLNCDQGDGAGNWNQRRLDGSKAIVRWAQRAPTTIRAPYVLIMGDVNAYAKEDPVTYFIDQGYQDLNTRFDGNISYVFDGRWGSVDFALANSGLQTFVTGANAWKINAQEPTAFDYNVEYKGNGERSGGLPAALAAYYNDDPFRSSDHNPVVVGITFDDRAEGVPVPALGGGLAFLTLGLGLCGLGRRRCR